MEQEKSNTDKPRAVVALSTLISPVEKIPLYLIGCGGTGSQVLQGLARMNHALENLGHRGFHVIAYDPDIVTESNIGRQLFSSHDIGKNKAGVLIEKINRFYGYEWEFVPEAFAFPERRSQLHIYMTCVDKVKPRHELLKKLHKNKLNLSYWMDFGNSKNNGQVVLGEFHNMKGIKLSGIDHYGIPEEDDLDTPSCSLAEALNKQDLFINTMVANVGLSMLWSAFRTLKFRVNASFINLSTLTVKSTLITHKNESGKA